MSSLFVKVRKFERLPHPNADSMFIAVPDGASWQCCCRTDSFEGEDLGIYIPVDSLLPSDMAQELGLPNVVPGEPYRVRTIRLRSKLSQGLLLPNRGRFKEGEDVAAVLGITKYVEPEPTDKDLRPRPDGFWTYTNIENVKNFPSVLQIGEEVVYTEKIHGKTFCAGWVCGEFYCGSASTAFVPEASNKWMQVAKKYDLEDKLRPYYGAIVYGELFGSGVQPLKYGLDDCDLRLFDLYISSEQRYADYDEFEEVWCYERLGVPHVPSLWRGDYRGVEHLEAYTSGKSLVDARYTTAHIREGVVVRPVKERWDFDNGLGRVILKSINPDYLLKNYD